MVSPTWSARRRTPAAFAVHVAGRGPRSTRRAVAGRSTWAGPSAHPDHGDERAGDRGIALGDRPQPAQVGVDGAYPQWSRARDGGQGEVGAGGQRPRVVDGRARGGEEAAGEVVLAVHQAVTQRQRLGGGDRHALPVDRVERA